MAYKRKSNKKLEPIIIDEIKEEVVPEDNSISEVVAETIPDVVVLEEKTVVTVEEVEPVVIVEAPQKTIIIESVPVIEEVKSTDTKELEEIKRLREKLNNGTISDGEAAMLFELLKD
jgi:hypothetical protein